MASISLHLNKKNDPVLLTMGPYQIYIDDSQANGLLNVKPIKAKNANKWIVRRQSATDAPNYFITSDFRTFKRLTDLQPQKRLYLANSRTFYMETIK